jgi:hypothetical protein
MHGLHQVNSDYGTLQSGDSQHDPNVMLFDEFLLSGPKAM